MQQLLFIDSNIYLRFYDTHSNELKKLLKTLVELRKDIFVTTQIRNEVLRNKIDVFLTAQNQSNKHFGFNKTGLPEHFEKDTDKLLKSWNAKNKDIEKDTKQQQRSLVELTKTLIQNIIQEKDEVSKSLNKIFSGINEPTDLQINKAKQRKDFGNPPGKKADPLGDQITWEQLLDSISKVDELWIISNDTDYFSIYGEECYLNAFLFSELRKIKTSLKVNTFNSLATGLKSYNEIKKISSLPNDELLNKITEEEKKIDALSSFDDKAYFYHGKARVKLNCPTCDGNNFIGPDITISKFGGLIKTFHCLDCNNYFESQSTLT